MQQVALLVAHLGLGKASRFAPVLQLRGTWMSLKEQLCPATCEDHIRREKKESRGDIGKEKVILSLRGPWGRACFATTRLTDAILSWTCCTPYPKGNHGGI